MIIDPKNKMLWFGDETPFADGYANSYMTHSTIGGTTNYDDRSAFINNLIDYMLLAARYGSHFTDLLRDDLNLPAPWDSSWEDRKWDY